MGYELKKYSIASIDYNLRILKLRDCPLEGTLGVSTHTQIN